VGDEAFYFKKAPRIESEKMKLKRGMLSTIQKAHFEWKEGNGMA